MTSWLLSVRSSLPLCISLTADDLVPAIPGEGEQLTDCRQEDVSASDGVGGAITR